MKKLNHATKYTIFICIFLTIFNLIFGYVFIKVSAKAIRTQIDERMLDISNTAAAMVNGDDLENLTADNAMYADKRAFYQNHEDRRKQRG